MIHGLRLRLRSESRPAKSLAKFAVASATPSPPRPTAGVRLLSSPAMQFEPKDITVIGAGPVGLMLAALFQPMEGFAVHLYEKRRAYTRTRMVQLRDYLVADSVASYCTDYIDGESVEALSA